MASARRGLPHHAAEQKVRASHVREQDGENERDYEVGRGKPPVHSRFKNGQSANPRGPRPRNLPALPVEALNDKVVITMDGVSRRDLAAGAGASPLRLPADRRAAPPRRDGGQPQAGAPGDAR